MTRLWARKVTRPRVIRQQQYENAYIYGAVCPMRDLAVGLVLPNVNIHGMQLHLDEISKQTPSGHHAVVVFDQAAWHTSQKINIFSNVSLVSLPAASPELNPQEQVWQWLRDHDLANRCFKNYDDIVDACCKAWNNFTSVKDRIKQLCYRNWIDIMA